MWVQLGGPVLVAVAIAFANRWAVPGRARRVSHATAEAELVKLLDDGPARDALASKLDVDVITHVKLERNRRFRLLKQWAFGVLGLEAVAAGALTASSMTGLMTDPDPAWAQATMPVSLVAAALLQGVVWILARQMRDITEDSQEEAEVQTAEAAGRASLNLSASGSSAPQSSGTASLYLEAHGG